VGNSPTSNFDYLGNLKLSSGEPVVTKDLQPNKTQATNYPGGRTFIIDIGSEGNTTLKYKIDPECVCKHKGTDKEYWILKEYTVVIFSRVLLVPDDYETDKNDKEHIKFISDNENDHVVDFTKWAKITEVKNIATAIEAFYSKDTGPTKRYETNDKCKEVSITNFIQWSRLRSSASKAVSDTIKEYDIGPKRKHKWRGKSNPIKWSQLF
jgi:hypothetical protein